MINLDQANLKILAALQENATQTAEDIAAKVHLSPSAVQKRLKQLRSSGVIEREVAILSPDVAGGFTFFLVNIQLARGKHNAIERFRALMRDTPEVMQCYHVTGAFDFLLLIAAPDARAYEGFSNRMFTEENHVARFETSVVLRSVKTSFALPLNTE